MVINGTLILESFPHRLRTTKYLPGVQPSLREQMQSVVRKALGAGLDGDAARYAQRFLNSEI
jgi:hypothetical protein